MKDQLPEILLFDLGGVIVPWVGIEELAKLSEISVSEVKRRLKASSIFHDYETGQCSDDAFTAEMVTVFELSSSQDDFAKLWNSWVHATYPNTKSTLKTLRQKFQLACLSNTNALHWNYIGRHIDLSQYFDVGFASHEIGYAKPDLESYRYVLDVLEASPNVLWFFDDTLENVEAARELGITSYHVDNQKGVVPILKDLGLI